MIFYKRPETICGPNENIIIPEGLTGISGSAELGVIIKKRLENVTLENAMDYVLGFTVRLTVWHLKYPLNSKTTSPPNTRAQKIYQPSAP